MKCYIARRDLRNNIGAQNSVVKITSRVSAVVLAPLHYLDNILDTQKLYLVFII